MMKPWLMMATASEDDPGKPSLWMMVGPELSHFRPRARCHSNRRRLPTTTPALFAQAAEVESAAGDGQQRGDRVF